MPWSDFDKIHQETLEREKERQAATNVAFAKSSNLESSSLDDEFNRIHQATLAREVESRGPLGDIVSGIVRGVAVEMPSLFLDTIGATERIARKAFGYEQQEEVGPIGEIARESKESLEKFRAEHPILRAKEKPGIISQGVEAASMSLASGAPGAAAGFAIGSMFGPASPVTAPLGALIGFALSGGVTFGLSEYENIIQMADEQGISRNESEPAAIISGIAEGGFEFASDLITGGILKVAKPLTTPAKEMLKTGIRQAFKTGLKETLARSGAVMASETSMEMLTAGVQAEQYKKIGLGDSSFWEGAKEAMGPAFVASVIFAGVGTGATRLHRNSIRRRIENGAIDPKLRMEAAEEVGETLDKIDPEIGKVWRDNAAEAIKNKENIETDDPDLIRRTAFERANSGRAGLTAWGEATIQDIEAEEYNIKQEIQAEKKEDTKRFISAGIASNNITDEDAYPIGKNVGLETGEINQAIIYGMDVQRMINEQDPDELRSFASANDINIPESVTDGKQLAFLVSEGLKEDGSTASELARQVKNLEETATKPGMEKAAENLEKKKAALEKVMPEAEAEKEVEGDQALEGRLAPIQPEERLEGETKAPGGTLPEPERGGEARRPGELLEGEEVVATEKVEGAKAKEATEAEKTTPKKEAWEMTAEEWRNKAINEFHFKPSKKAHKIHVKQALSEGKPVPKKVLAEYPDLKPPPSPEKTKIALEAERVETERRKEALPVVVEHRTGEERRKDLVFRKKVSEMTPEEREHVLLTDELTKLPNKRAFDEAEAKEPAKRIARFDLDNFKQINKTMTYKGADKVLAKVGEIAREEGVEVYREHGDEFIGRGDERLEENIKKLQNRLENVIVDYTAPDGTVYTQKGVKFSYGVESDIFRAEKAQTAQKTERAKAGLRHEREDLESARMAEGLATGRGVVDKGRTLERIKPPEKSVYNLLKEANRLGVAQENYKNYVDYNKRAVSGGEVLPFKDWLEQQSPHFVKYAIGESIPAKANEPLINLLRKSPPLKKANIGLSKDGTVWVRNKSGQGFNVKSVTHIEPDKVALKIGHGRMLKDGEFIKGKYQDGTIELQRDLADEWTATHEALHAIRSMGMITKLDESILSNHVKNLQKKGKWDSETREPGSEEDWVIYATRFMRDRSIKGPVRQVLQKIADLVDMFVNIFHETARGVLREIESGKAFEKGLKEPTISDKEKYMTSKKGPGDITTTETPESPMGGLQPITGESKMPKEAVLSVLAGSKNANYKMGSGEAYLDNLGNLILDGEKYTVGDVAYLHDGKFYKIPPKELIKDVKERIDEATGYVDTLKETMWQIRWKEPDSHIVKAGEKYTNIFGMEEIAEVDMPVLNEKRYVNVSEYNSSYIRDVESLVNKPDANALMQALYDKELKEYEFEVGGILHVADENPQLSKAQKAAIEYYKSAGGRLGRTAIEALERPELIEAAEIAYGPGAIRSTKKKIKPVEDLPKPSRPPGEGGQKIPQYEIGTAKQIDLSQELTDDIAFDKKKIDLSKEGISKIASRLYTKFIMQEYPVVSLAKKAGKEMAERIENQVRRLRGKGGIVEAILTADPKAFEGLKKSGITEYENITKSLKDILMPLSTKDMYHDYERMRVAQRDLAFAKFRPDIKGVDEEKAQKTIDLLQRKYGDDFSKLEDISKEHREFERQAVLQPLVKAGWLSKENYDNIVNKPESEYYASFLRQMEDAERQIVGSGKEVVKRIHGSEKQKIPSVEGTIANVQRTVKLVESLRLNKQVVELKDLPGFEGVFEEVKPQYRKIAGKYGIYHQTDKKEMAGDVYISRALKTFENKYDAEAFAAKRPDTYAIKHPDESISIPVRPYGAIVVAENGKKTYYEVPEDIYKALDYYTPEEMNSVVKILSIPTRILRAGATLSTEFIARNPARDQFTAMIYSKYGYNPFKDFAKGIYHLLNKTDLYNEFKAAGGEQSYFVSLDRQSTNITARNLTGYKKEGKEKFATLNPVEALRMLSEWMEKGTRLGLYAKAKEKGATALEAMAESREGTLDFGRIGQEKALNQIIAFWNANLQGTDKMVRSFKFNPGRALTRTALGITLPSIILWGINHDHDRYKSLPEWQKNFFWIILTGKDGPIIRIPKPFELGVIFGSLPERILDHISMNDSKSLKSITEAIGEGASPGLIPTAALPFIEHVANYSFFRGRSLEPMSVQRRSPGMRYTAYTTEIMKSIGETTDISPIKLENWVNVWTGTLGRTTLDLMDQLYKPENIPEVSKKWYEITPAIKGFIAREPIGSASKDVNDFYEYAKKVTEAKADYQILHKKNADESVKFYKEYGPRIRLAKQANLAIRKMANMRRRINNIVVSKTIPPETKRRKIDDLNERISKIAKRFNELYLRVV